MLDDVDGAMMAMYGEWRWKVRMPMFWFTSLTILF
jgi:hypothetical protein